MRLRSVALANPGMSDTKLVRGWRFANNGVANLLHAANFSQGTIDVFDGSFIKTIMPGAFIDPALPAGLAPFNIQQLGAHLFVAYARTDGSAGVVVDKFNLESGLFLGELIDPGGNPWIIPGLWAVKVGNGGAGGSESAVLFTTGPNGGQDGLLAELLVVGPGTPFTSLDFPTREAAVPEPDSLSLVGAVLAALGLACHRRLHVILCEGNELLTFFRRASGARAAGRTTGGSQKARVAAAVDAARADTEPREWRSGDIEQRREREGLR